MFQYTVAAKDSYVEMELGTSRCLPLCNYEQEYHPVSWSYFRKPVIALFL